MDTDKRLNVKKQKKSAKVIALTTICLILNYFILSLISTRPQKIYVREKNLLLSKKCLASCHSKCQNTERKKRGLRGYHKASNCFSCDYGNKWNWLVGIKVNKKVQEAHL